MTALAMYLVLLLCCFYSGVAFADDGATGGSPTLEQVLDNINETMPALTALVTASAYVGGTILIFQAITKLKAYGEMRAMTSTNADLKGPLVGIFIGSCLIFSPTIIDVSLTSVFGSNSILAYPSDQSSWDKLSETLVLIVNVVGGIAFIRGLYHMHRVGQGQAQQGTFAKGMVHIIGGVLAMNIVGTTNVIFNALGLAPIG